MPGISKRGALLAGLTALALTAAVGIAWAATANITTTANNLFSASAYQHDAGTVATLTHAGGGPHNVTAVTSGPDGDALFRSATISSGSTPVNGTEFVAAGSYGFVCTVHAPGMSGTLNVTGTPKPRPSVTIKVLSTKIDKAAKGNLRLRLTGAGSPSTVDLVASLGKKTLADAENVPTTVGRPTTTTLKLTKAGRAALEDRDKANVKVAGSVDFGTPAAAKRKLK